MTVNNGKLCHEFFALVLVDDHVLFSGTAHKEVIVCVDIGGFFLISAIKMLGYPVIVGNTVVGTGLFVLVPFLVVVVLVVHGVVQTETVDVP